MLNKGHFIAARDINVNWCLVKADQESLIAGTLHQKDAKNRQATLILLEKCVILLLNQKT